MKKIIDFLVSFFYTVIRTNICQTKIYSIFGGIIMFESKKKYVFLNANVIHKEKNGLVNEYRFITFADPDTFENHQVTFSKNLDLSNFRKGQKIHVIGELDKVFGRSQFVVCDVIPV